MKSSVFPVHRLSEAKKIKREDRIPGKGIGLRLSSERGPYDVTKRGSNHLSLQLHSDRTAGPQTSRPQQLLDAITQSNHK